MPRKPPLTSAAVPSSEFVDATLVFGDRGGSQTFIYDANDTSSALALVYGVDPKTRRRDPRFLGNARRLVACSNACRGISTDALEAGVLTQARKVAQEALDWLENNDEGQTGVAVRLRALLRDLGLDKSSHRTQGLSRSSIGGLTQAVRQ